MPPRRLIALLLSSLSIRHGRPAALLALLLAVWLLPMVERTPLVQLQALQFDLLQQIHPRERSDIPVLIVAIDEKSLEKIGQWPWSRQILAELVSKINQGKPLAIGLDMVFPEPDRFDPQYLQRMYPNLNTAILPDPDTLFAKALRQSPSVLGIAATDTLVPGSHTRLKVSPVISRGGDSALIATYFSSALTSLPKLEAATRSQALLNPRANPTANDPERGILRHMPLVASIAGLPVASLGPEMLRIALEEPAVVAHIQQNRIHRISVGDYSLPTQSDGSLIVHFGRLQADRYISAIDLLEGRIALENFENRFVLIGFTGIGLQDLVVTPLGEKIPGVDAHAQVLESFLSGQALDRPQWMRTLEMVILTTLGLLMVIGLPRTSPWATIGIGFLGVATLLVLMEVFFFVGYFLLDTISLLILLAPVFFILIGNNLVVADRRRRQAEKTLQASRDMEAKIAGELEAARRIQAGLLPDPLTLFSNETRFSLAARVEPALEVGGDYFDCFLLDEQHLCVAVGDVSGKGLPASLFMAMTKSVSEALLRQYPKDLSTAMVELNTTLTRHNREMLFVTTFVGILDLETGYLDYACAGHTAPYLLRKGVVERVPIAHISGPPLCALADFPYPKNQITLQTGDYLIMVTDGVTEASNGEEWFGSAKLEELLRESTLKGTNAQDLANQIITRVQEFEEGIPAFDDLTLLVLQWHGPSSLH